MKGYAAPRWHWSYKPPLNVAEFVLERMIEQVSRNIDLLAASHYYDRPFAKIGKTITFRKPPLFAKETHVREDGRAGQRVHRGHSRDQ